MSTLPRKDADFNVSQEIIAGTADGRRSDWMLDSEWLDNQLLPKKTEWENAWEAYRNPATRTPLITSAKREARKEYEKLLRILVRNLEHNTRVTNDDRRNMGITIPSATRTAVPPPSSYPEFSVDTSVIRRLSLHFRNQGSDSRAKPKGVHGVEIKWGIRDTPPQAVTDLLNSSFDTRTPFTLEFEENQRGKNVWFCLRWENTKGEKGPWSEMIGAIIP
ncbi:MAG: hypothetical protein LBQ60_13710 [Bacteroidales bacterium]|jgi:hypothetical protein|nr:hypothetical protein [Bacteroidales bacterium]